MVYFELNPEEIAELDRDVAGVGGFQSFIKGFQKQLNHATGEIKLTDDDMTEIQHFAFDYEQGGFQDRLLFIFGRVLGAQLGREE